MSKPLESCDQEPIHALGLIQNHGALVAFDHTGRLFAQSLNAFSLLGNLPAVGDSLSDAHFDAVARTAIARALAEPGLVSESLPCVGLHGQPLDLVLHWADGMLVAEWEMAALDAPSAGHYAALLQRSIQQLHGSMALPLNQLLQVACDAVRALTGFDRVMAYRFLPDDTGQVAAESIGADVPSYLHLRYPAGDIPAQARRLYVLNPVRHIADVDAQPVPVRAGPDLTRHATLDLSHSILRSVSPTHVSYLKNMGVAGSMSVSIVVNGKLWGLMACHNLTPLCPSYAVRTSSTVLAQVLAIMVERAELSARTAAETQIEALRARVSTALTSAEDTIAALNAARADMQDLIASDGFSIIVGHRVSSFPDDLSRGAALRVADFMTRTRQDLLVTDSLVRDLPGLDFSPGEKGNRAGLLAIQMNAETIITIVWWRAELVETINWAGAREKHAGGDAGPASLVPRLSFALWQETVRGTSQAWGTTDQYAARELKFTLQELALNQMLAISDEHAALLAIMGHDLRDPLQAIDMVVTLMARGRISSDDGAQRIAYSSQRMQSLISYILDVSRLRTGVGLAMTSQPTALGPLLTETLDQAQSSHPGVEMQRNFGQLGNVMLDRDRFVQAMSNLLSNARQHGDMRYPIWVDANVRDGVSVIEIKNRIAPGQAFIPGPMTSQLKKTLLDNPRNKQGLGLGLYIANAIIAGHGGSLACECVDQNVTFRITLADLAARNNSGASEGSMAVKHLRAP